MVVDTTGCDLDERLRDEREERLPVVLEAVRASVFVEPIGDAELILVGLEVVFDVADFVSGTLFEALADLTLSRVTYDSLTNA